ncbi:MAG: YfhO family protein [Acidimicrobiales bacterium]
MIAALVASWRRHRWLADAAGVGVIVFVALLYLSPALKDGFSFGPTDLGAQASYLTRGAVTAPAHNQLIGDVIDQDVPWNTLDWRIVHQGSLPLWDSYAGTGLPELFNFESAPLALPSLLGYLFPVSASFLVTVLGKLLIAGIGTYVCCRVLRLGAIGATLGGVSFMLSGSFAGWLGWALGGPVAWSGFIVAGVVLAYRSRRRVRDLWLLSLAVAFAVYGGFPEEYVLMGVVLGGIMAVTALGSLVVNHRLAPRGLARVAVGLVGGFALSAPLWLPGAPLLTSSARLNKQLDGQFPLHMVAALFAQGYYGLPIHGSTWFGVSNYVESTAYVGVIALVLAGVAVLIAWRRPVVVGLALGALGCLLVTYQIHGTYVRRFVTALGLSALPIHRILIVLGFPVAVLAGIGCDAVVKRFHERSVRAALGGATAAVAAVIGLLWLTVDDKGLTALERSLRRSSLLWPSATILLLVVVWSAALLVRRAGAPARRRCGAALGATLVSGQAAFLLFAGVGMNSYFTTAFPTTPAVATVQRTVGSGLLALDGSNVSCGTAAPTAARAPCGVRQWLGIGFLPNIQLGYAVDELAMHDPTIPQSYFTSWPVPDSGQVFAGNLQLFSPAINSLALARRYGVSYVLVGPGDPVPSGMTALSRIPIGHGAHLTLAKVPDSARFTFLAPASRAEVLSARHPGDASYSLQVRVAKPAELVLRITYEPGWHVTADGRPLAVHRYEGSFLAVTVPAGAHTIVAHYWPRDLTYGIVLALLALLVLALAPFAATYRRVTLAALAATRRRLSRPDPGDRAEPPA